MDFQKLHDVVLDELNRRFPEENLTDNASAMILQSIKELAVSAATIMIREYDRQKNISS